MATIEDGSGASSLAAVDRITLGRAVVAGLVGGVAFGVPLQLLIGRMGAIGALYNAGTESLAIGWVAHLFHSALFGVVLGLITETGPLRAPMERSLVGAAAVGAGFGLFLYGANIGFLWPFWLETVGFPPAQSWSLPYTPAKPLFGHLLYGVITGTVFHALVDY
jgi:two-component system OmpR family sensor kinase